MTQQLTSAAIAACTKNGGTPQYSGDTFTKCVWLDPNTGLPRKNTGLHNYYPILGLAACVVVGFLLLKRKH